MPGTHGGITFQETMSGPFALGITDPTEGAAASSAQTLAMHGTILIDDIDAFIGSPGHPGRLDVVMDYPPFGTGLSAPGGVFKLFSPTGDPKLKLMVYEWPLVHNGKQYYFAGQKNVVVHPLLELWHDTTTLQTHLYEGTDKSGPIVGAGVISLSFGQLLAMSTHFKSVGAPNSGAGIEAVSRFGQFFMGELWDTYIKRAGEAHGL